jgi:hypothetical protein
VSDHQLAPEDAQRALRGESPPPVILDSRLGAALDLVSGRAHSARCGSGALDLLTILGLPHPLSPEQAAIVMRCRSCSNEQALTVSAEDGALVLTTVTMA